jgi:hypothetical protein
MYQMKNTLSHAGHEFPEVFASGHRSGGPIATLTSG